MLSPDTLQAIYVLIAAFVGWFAKRYFDQATPAKPAPTPAPEPVPVDPEPLDPIDDEVIEYAKAILKQGWRESAMQKLKDGLKSKEGS